LTTYFWCLVNTGDFDNIFLMLGEYQIFWQPISYVWWSWF
jgi:hypothetical protein